VEPKGRIIPAVSPHATFQPPPSVAEERGWPAEGTSVPTAIFFDRYSQII